MKLRLLFFIFILGFGIKNLSAEVNTRLVLVSNTYDFPSPGLGTLIIDVEASHDNVLPFNIEINNFNGAFLMDENFKSVYQDIDFTMQNFPSPDYSQIQNYFVSTGVVRYMYSFNSGARGTVTNLAWTTIVRVTFTYTMTDLTTTVSWYSGEPDFFVTNNTDTDITGSEEEIPGELTNAVLPVELSSFSAKQTGDKIKLLWQTKTEVNNFGFDIERKTGAETAGRWDKIGFVPGSGNSNSVKNYSFTDVNPAGAKVFIYRLRQIDNDGEYAYSKEVKVELIPAAYELYQNYPNPFNPSTFIKFSIPEGVHVKIDIFNIIGEYITTVLDRDLEAGFHQIEFNSGDLTSGTYIYKIQAGKFSRMKKMMIIK